jgi:hypothetical protein
MPNLIQKEDISCQHVGCSRQQAYIVAKPFVCVQLFARRNEYSAWPVNGDQPVLKGVVEAAVGNEYRFIVYVQGLGAEGCV